MKKEKHSAPPSSYGIKSTAGKRLLPAGKHAKGRAPKLYLGEQINPGFRKGAFKKRVAKAKRKAQFIASSQREAIAIARRRSTLRRLNRLQKAA